MKVLRTIVAAVVVVATASSARAQTPSLNQGGHQLPPNPYDEMDPLLTRSEDRVSTTTMTSAEIEGRPEPERVEAMGARPNRLLLVSGVSAFAGAYLTSAIVGAANGRESDRLLVIPVAGPWFDLANRDCDAVPCDAEGLSTALLVTSGVLQAGGLAAMLASTLLPERPSPHPFETNPPRHRASLHVLPITVGAGGGAGLGAVGQF